MVCTAARPSNPPCSQLQNADAFECSPGGLPACFPVRVRQIHRARGYKMLTHFNARPGGHAGLFPCLAAVKSTMLAATKCWRISMLARRTCRTAEAVPELAGFREQKAVLRVFVPKKCCFRERKGNCPEGCSGISGIFGTRGGLSEVCSEFGGISGTKCSRSVKNEVRPFCWTDLTIRDNGLSSVLYRTHSV